MKNQIMSISLIILFVILSFASDGRLLVEAQLIKRCEVKERLDPCTQESCHSLCDKEFSSILQLAKGYCLGSKICNCVYYSFNTHCHMPNII
ncbi:hypothetical protein HN51_064914 [Arachis hypogaea]|nr:uncharacterized protein DS421_14g450500 [Arachis hypogaea]